MHHALSSLSFVRSLFPIRINLHSSLSGRSEAQGRIRSTSARVGWSGGACGAKLGVLDVAVTETALDSKTERSRRTTIKGHEPSTGQMWSHTACHSARPVPNETIDTLWRCREDTAANRQEMLPSATARTLVAMNVPVPLQCKDSAVALTETDDWGMNDTSSD